MVSQDRWSLVTGSVALRCETLPEVCGPLRQVQWSLPFKNPLFKNSLYFKTTYQWHYSYIFSINIPSFKTTSNLRPYFPGWRGGLKMQDHCYLSWQWSLKTGFTVWSKVVPAIKTTGSILRLTCIPMLPLSPGLCLEHVEIWNQWHDLSIFSVDTCTISLH